MPKDELITEIEVLKGELAAKSEQVNDLEARLKDAEADRTHLEGQIKRLADYLLANYSEHITEGGAVDVAIKILTHAEEGVFTDLQRLGSFVAERCPDVIAGEPLVDVVIKLLTPLAGTKAPTAT